MQALKSELNFEQLMNEKAINQQQFDTDSKKAAIKSLLEI